jgi:ribosome maturation factor RimP
VRLFGKSEVGDEEHTLQIMAERPDTGQLIMDDCVTLSHRISDRIDALEEAGETLIMRPIASRSPRRASTVR